MPKALFLSPLSRTLPTTLRTKGTQITSRFDGIIKKLHYEADDMALVGKVRISDAVSLLSFPTQAGKLIFRSPWWTLTYRVRYSPRMKL